MPVGIVDNQSKQAQGNAFKAPHSVRSQLATQLINGILAIKPLATLAKHQARSMMVKRAEKMGVPWTQTVYELRTRDITDAAERRKMTKGLSINPNCVASVWEDERLRLESPDIHYPDYYLTSFHAYDEGNLGWLPAMEQEVAALAVHSTIWPGDGVNGDAHLRRTYHDVLKEQLPNTLAKLVDFGCGIGLSTTALQEAFPQTTVSGVDLSSYLLAIARYRQQQNRQDSKIDPIQWVHSAAEATPFDDQSHDLVSAFLIFHELPQSAARNILQEARRILRPGGYLAIMDMNPQSSVYSKMPPFIFTLLKSTEPYLDEYMSLDLEQTIYDAGFQYPSITCNSHRHRTVIAQVR